MQKHEPHITSYFQHGVILVALLFLTFVTIFVAELNLGTISIAVALFVASVKGFLVLTYFMHLKYEKLLFRLITGMAFLLFAMVLVITFLDYGLRGIV